MIVGLYFFTLVFIEANIQPADVTAEVTTEVFFECVAEGYRPDTFKYQWMFNGNEIADATDNILIFSSVSEDQNGMYKCVVINYWNMTTSSASAQLTVTSNVCVRNWLRVRLTLSKHFIYQLGTLSIAVVIEVY